jgi:flagellar protein FlaF
MLQAQTAYGRNSRAIKTPRDTEYDAIAQITRRMKAADGKAERFSDLAAALHENRRLWTILSADVAHPDNPLPQDLKARLFYLAEFTDAHSSRVLQKQTSAAPLIEINTAVMRGLRARSNQQ